MLNTNAQQQNKRKQDEHPGSTGEHHDFWAFYPYKKSQGDAKQGVSMVSSTNFMCTTIVYILGVLQNKQGVLLKKLSKILTPLVQNSIQILDQSNGSDGYLENPGLSMVFCRVKPLIRRQV